MVLIDVAMLVFTADGALKLILGSLIGLSLGLTGVGGGVLIIPVLQLFFGMGTIMLLVPLA
ncbi:hypothetical protein JCM19241_3318 [Vibrio ishigakensis]|uniref:Uncharacterized protein n=1 Tax=Vibrio ishigakensis TaxID=1481914 RepID=A0A0B8QA02_9VIBR|nr:hypothetical protein JCM19241_3318 [Vibrio ishigakensis]